MSEPSNVKAAAHPHGQVLAELEASLEDVLDPLDTPETPETSRDNPSEAAPAPTASTPPAAATADATAAPQDPPPKDEPLVVEIVTQVIPPRGVPLGELLQHQITGMQNDVARLQTRITELEQELARLTHDYDGYRNRTERRVDDAKRFAHDKLLASILPVLDNFERAMAAAGDNEKKGEQNPLYRGLRMVYQQLTETLTAAGAVRFVSLGQTFDPARHEAMSGMPTDQHPAHTIIEELEAGYTIEGRLLRPAKVVVALPR
jgi:molecular chaperone GrpE